MIKESSQQDLVLVGWDTYTMNFVVEITQNVIYITSVMYVIKRREDSSEREAENLR